MKHQSMSLLEVMSGSVGMQKQESLSMSVAHIATKIHADVPVWVATWDCIDVQGIFGADPSPHWL